MTTPANAVRGEAMLAGHRLRPSFAALVAAEAELGPLFALVERAAGGQLTLAETVSLLWHLVDPREAKLSRDDFGQAVCDAGMTALAPVIGTVLAQIVKGRG